MIGELFAIIAPVFLGAAVGYGWAKLGQPYDTALVSKLLVFVTTPCLVFSHLSELSVNPNTFGVVALAAVAALGVFTVAGVVALKVFKVPLATGLPPILFPNNGNMGLALCLFAFGEEGLEFGIGYFVVFTVATFVLAPIIASGTVSLKRVVGSPLLYATAAAVIIMLTGTQVPAWLYNTTSLLGDVSIPLMIITLGVSLAQLQVTSLKTSVLVSVLRLTIGFATGVVLAKAFGLTGVPQGVFIIMCAMPAAVINYLFAQQYGKNAEDVAGAVVISTALSFMTMPALLWYVL